MNKKQQNLYFFFEFVEPKVLDTIEHVKGKPRLCRHTCTVQHKICHKAHNRCTRLAPTWIPCVKKPGCNWKELGFY